VRGDSPPWGEVIPVGGGDLKFLVWEEHRLVRWYGASGGRGDLHRSHGRRILARLSDAIVRWVGTESTVIMFRTERKTTREASPNDTVHKNR
jgi:hypothetical protein